MVMAMDKLVLHTLQPINHRPFMAHMILTCIQPTIKAMGLLQPHMVLLLILAMNSLHHPDLALFVILVSLTWPSSKGYVLFL